MKRLACFYLCGLLLMAWPALASAQQRPAPGQRETLTNEAIINLSKAKFKESTIISIINTSPVAFDISTTKLIELKKRGVNERIVMAMIERQTYSSNVQNLASLGNDDFFSKDDEAFFNNSDPALRPPTNKRPDDKATKENESDIFGSRSGSKSKSQARGLGSGNAEQGIESDVNGSATVRIIRPPNETGGGPKLERAPKLDNQAILELIQAGFSEGTILRKIEASQVDFDLSPKALAALRQNRVTERVIKAMTDAMDEEKK